mgnify:CR=1 FL=1
MVENIDETKTILNTNEVSLRYLNNNFMDTKMKFSHESGVGKIIPASLFLQLGVNENEI